LARWFFRAALVVCILSLAAVTVTRLSNRHYGNIEEGGTLFLTSRLQCFGCHASPPIAPPLIGSESRARENAAAVNKRLAQYLAESILAPDRYVAPRYVPGGMPHYNLFEHCATCAQAISLKELRDIVAYLMTL
jgi:hypothetical protein